MESAARTAGFYRIGRHRTLVRFQVSFVLCQRGGLMRIPRAFLCIAAGAVAAILTGQGIVIEQKPAFAPTDRFQTKGIVVQSGFKTADGSVHPAGTYAFKVQGTGKAGEAAIIVIGSKTGKPVGKVTGTFEAALGGPDTKTSGKAGEAGIIIIDTKTGKPAGKVEGAVETALGGPDTKTSQRSSRGSTTVRFDKLGFSAASPVSVMPKGDDMIIIIGGGKQGSIRATLAGGSGIR
jgi:hypothetical protein